ncbi:hypothetical protein [Pseudomonas fluorescens]|uniref:Uncharacterized protein n=1 Tax=Pseudomonas fluorescens TaxID=294 RepID=A0A120FYP1_PSEFL|nr:hypothetical protein [Pseudomonas fluorescens]KWV73392.1 hypothetical protein PFL603g_03502 [Pseudomonas fluorescens]
MRTLTIFFTTLLSLCIAFTVHAVEPPESKVPPTSDKKITRANYLLGKYGDRLHFSSSQARSVVEDFEIDCRVKDGRYLPLLSLLLARVSEMQHEGAWMETIVQQRGDEVRVYDQIKRRDGTTFEPILALELNRWGELIPISIRSEAILNACFDGPYGRLWVPEASD